ncbi:hypothetical protein DPMN_103144 [Dreissena polymorpha]|uniref:Uncharacterized protein n=1 Tax=Dreissena polymorpha TaxID=45954 RepID=A0A9D4H7C8_DREPO|nr:hypothetical protein DPMN_103144 [Dreissena polymorpha]
MIVRYDMLYKVRESDTGIILSRVIEGNGDNDDNDYDDDDDDDDDDNDDDDIAAAGDDDDDDFDDDEDDDDDNDDDGYDDDDGLMLTLENKKLRAKTSRLISNKDSILDDDSVLESLEASF